MENIIEFISRPWSWYVSGTAIALVMVTLIFFGKTFGFSSNLRTMCAIGGAGKVNKFFDFDWKAQLWNMWFLAGSIIGGWIAVTFLSGGEPVVIAQSTVSDLAALGVGAPQGLQPAEIFNIDFLFSLKGFIVMIGGGFLIGFGSRYAGGCTSGHAISGLSDLQLPSLIAVVGFFIGGLAMTYLLQPLIFNF